MFTKLPGLAILAGFSASLMGCAAMTRKSTGELFIHGTEAELSASKFYLDGDPVTPSYHEYSASEVSRTSTTVTFSVTSLPAIHVGAGKQYSTLTIENASGEKKNVLIKRDLIGGYKGILYCDLFLTIGIGDVVDTYTDNLFGLPEIDMGVMAQPESNIYQIGVHGGN
jgi:hypothetical protein